MMQCLAQSQPSSTWVEHRLEFDALPENWGAVLLIAGVALAVAWVVRTYRAEARTGAPRGARTFLGVVRGLVIVALAVIWIEPVRAPYEHHHVESTTIVLADRSASMAVADHYPIQTDADRIATLADRVGQPLDLPVSRAMLRDLVLDPQLGLLAALAQRNSVRVLTFAEDVTPELELPALRDADPSAEPLTVPAVAVGPNNGQTDIGQALRQALADAAGAPIAGVVLLSDGATTRGEDLETLGAAAAGLQVPIHTIGVGDPSPPRNLAVVGAAAPAAVFVDDPFEVVARVAAAQLAGESITVELLEQALDGTLAPPRTVDSRVVAAGMDGAAVDVTFSHRQTRPGRFIYTVQVVADARESVLDDNVARLAVQFLDSRLRVLIVAGGPSWTARFLGRALQRDRAFDVSIWMQSADADAVRDGDTVIDHLPATAAELRPYDVIVLIDPDPTQLSDGWADLLDDQVTRNGAGVIYNAARKFTPRFFREVAVAPIVDLLPVVRDPDADLILNQVGYYQRDSAAVEFESAAWQHPAFAGGGGLSSPTPDDWRQMTRVFWHYPTRSEKPAASVLLRHGHPRMRNATGGHVLLATQLVGGGRSAFIGSDLTWRWRSHGEEVFNRVWVQLVRGMAEGRLTAAGGRGRLQVDREVYRPGDVAAFTARLTTPDHEPLADGTVTLELIDDRGARQAVTLTLDTNRPGWYGGEAVLPTAGQWMAVVALAGPPGEPAVVLSQTLAVTPSRQEIADVWLRRAALRRLSDVTDGRYYDMDEVLEVAAAIPDRHEIRIRRGSPEPLWDNAWVFGGLLALLGLEWALRKRWQML